MTVFSVQPDANAGIDTIIFSVQTTYNYGIFPQMIAGRSAAGQFWRSLIRFDVSSIPSGATVTAASISLYAISTQGTTDPKNVLMHRALTQWYEGNKSGAALSAGVDGSTWQYRNNNGAVAWGAAGGLADTDFSASATATTAVSGADAWYSFNVLADVADWVAGTATNYGHWILSDEANNHYKRFTSSDYTDNTSLRPKLDVTYTAGGTNPLFANIFNSEILQSRIVR